MHSRFLKSLISQQTAFMMWMTGPVANSLRPSRKEMNSCMQPKRPCPIHSEPIGIPEANVLSGYVHSYPFRLHDRYITNSKAFRVVLLGPRAIDGTNKGKRSQSRARKFAMTELSPSFLSFVATVVRLSEQLAILSTDRTKLFFLLDSSTTFSEDNERFRTFFENRYASLTDQFKKKLPSTLRKTMAWLNSEVFVSQGDDEGVEVDERQHAFENALDKEINEASGILRRRREEAIEEVRGSS